MSDALGPLGRIPNQQPSVQPSQAPTPAQPAPVRDGVKIGHQPTFPNRDGLGLFMGELKAAAESPNVAVREGVALVGKLDHATMQKLANDVSREVRMALAENPHVTADILIQLARLPDREIRLSVALNKNVPGSLLAKWAKDKKARMRDLAAISPFTDIGDLIDLAEDEDNKVRFFVACNPSAPWEALEKLLDGDRPIRERVARHPHLHESGFEKLAQDPDAGVRYQVAIRPDLPEQIRRKLAQDPNPYVRGA